MQPIEMLCVCTINTILNLSFSRTHSCSWIYVKCADHIYHTFEVMMVYTCMHAYIVQDLYIYSTHLLYLGEGRLRARVEKNIKFIPLLRIYPTFSHKNTRFYNKIGAQNTVQLSVRVLNVFFIALSKHLIWDFKNWFFINFANGFSVVWHCEQPNGTNNIYDYNTCVLCQSQNSWWVEISMHWLTFKATDEATRVNEVEERMWCIEWNCLLLLLFPFSTENGDNLTCPTEMSLKNQTNKKSAFMKSIHENNKWQTIAYEQNMDQNGPHTDTYPHGDMKKPL